jgi:hypothetical protein
VTANPGLGDIQNWRNEDAEIAEQLVASLTTANPVPTNLPNKIYAAHMVAAATVAALEEGANIPALFQRMLDLLKAKHDANPLFGPLFVRHPGNITRDRAYVPYRPSNEDVIAVAPAGRRSQAGRRNA